ncbi:protein mono-ADP-ribosyltransferase PARP11-like [Polypterus senegalus]|uniref:protein mono-ADP-ribosyltransferase PARP11-like n=1 Tax=Polypterus senegalus TaxID=55291 RepID=UPI001966C460|nr:protein mono-ADP-ribosyltransferase PARP11-like [Polypterus senegalus]
MSMRMEIDDDSEVEDMDTSDMPWCWFFKAECGMWHILDTESTNGSVTSKEIEEYYMNAARGTVVFTSNNYDFSLNFSEMKLTNRTTGSQCQLKRGPYHLTTFTFISDHLDISVPSHWENVKDESYQLISLDTYTSEYLEVSKLFRNTLAVTIKGIKRIQNIHLWYFFCRKKIQLSKIKQGKQLQEMKLFHGTDNANIGGICLYNFDPRLHGSYGGAVLGKGTYFARDAAYAKRYCRTSVPSTADRNQNKIIILARVLVGEYIAGCREYTRPPSKKSTPTNLYDSCVDDENNPKIYVIFDSNQIYPEYNINLRHLGTAFSKRNNRICYCV